MGALNWAILAVAAALGGCNMVASVRPLFSQADTAATPAFRPGLWAHDEPGCVFDASKPLGEWPACAGGSVMPTGQGVLRDDKGSEILIAQGDPLILQIRPVMNGGGEIRGYFYGAARPTAFDDQRRVIAAEAWPIECGPPPPKGPDGVQHGSDPGDFVTRKPLPGLKIDGGNCLAVNPAVVKKAATANLAWQKPQRTRWIRDGTD